MGSNAVITDFEHIKDASVLFDLRSLLKPNYEKEEVSEKQIVKICRILIDLCSKSKFKERLDDQLKAFSTSEDPCFECSKKALISNAKPPDIPRPNPGQK